MQVKRYRPGHGAEGTVDMWPAEKGEWCRYEDHAVEVAFLKAQLAEHKSPLLSPSQQGEIPAVTREDVEAIEYAAKTVYAHFQAEDRKASECYEAALAAGASGNDEMGRHCKAAQDANIHAATLSALAVRLNDQISTPHPAVSRETMPEQWVKCYERQPDSDGWYEVPATDENGDHPETYITHYSRTLKRGKPVHYWPLNVIAWRERREPYRSERT